MSKQYLVEIECCGACRYFDWREGDGGTEYYCSKADFIIISNDFPDWCPLEDYKATQIEAKGVQE